MVLRQVKYPFPNRRRRRLRTALLMGLPLVAVVALFVVGSGNGSSGSGVDGTAAGAAGGSPASVAAVEEADGGGVDPAASGPIDGEAATAGETASSAKGAAPTAVIVVGGASTPGVAVQFSSDGSAAADGGALTYRWDFGDGSFPPVTEPAPVHTYREAGNYTVTLTVTDSLGASGVATAEVGQTRPPGNITLVTRDVGLPSPGTVAPMRVWYQNQTPNVPVVAKICGVSMTDPAFESGSDCSLMSEVMVNGTASGDGWIDLQVFRGPEPGGDAPWGCFAPGDAAPQGVQAKTTCFVRVTSDVWTNTETQQEISFSVG